MPPRVPDDNLVRNEDGREVYNRYENKNTLRATGVRPVFADENYFAASKHELATRMTLQERQARIQKIKNTALDGVDFGGPEFSRGSISFPKVAGYLLFFNTNQLRTWLDFEGKCTAFCLVYRNNSPARVPYHALA